jgi:hypothetical protein
VAPEPAPAPGGAALAATGGDGALPGGWVAHTHRKSQRQYYENADTQERTWTRPQESADALTITSSKQSSVPSA